VRKRYSFVRQQTKAKSQKRKTNIHDVDVVVVVVGKKIFLLFAQLAETLMMKRFLVAKFSLADLLAGWPDDEPQQIAQ